MRVSFLSVAALVTAAVFLAPCLAPAQSLAEVAEKEKERRKAAQKPAKSYTEDDARNAKGSGASVTGTVVGTETKTEGGAAPAAGAKAEKSDSEKRADAQKAWREKLDKANADVSRLSSEVDAIQAQLNDPASAMYSPGRQQAVTRLDAAKKELADAKQRVDDVTEEGRRNGFR